MKLPASRESWQRVSTILDRTLELAPAQRAAVLDEACADSAELRAEVEELLAADARAGDFLEAPAGDCAGTLLTEAPEPPAAGASLVGRRLGPYRVVREIGAGGMGVVYEGRDVRLGRRVALKLLPPEWSRDAVAKERFVREGRATAALDHPNLCTVHDVGESDDGQLFIVMAFYEGETLQQKLRRGPLAAGEARELAIQIARGLRQAHAAGVVHRDVKPSNVMVTEAASDRAKILDFGIARVAGAAGLTRAGGSPGTPAYMSPEQASGDPVDERTDVWSLGVVLYEMLSGRRPFGGDGPQAVIHQILHREPPPLAQVCPTVPVALARTVAKAMAKDPGQRYQSVAELLADLESGTAPPSSVRPVRRRRLALAAVVVAVLSALAGWWTIRDTGLRPRSSIAVLRFENLSGEAELDWLRRGLADLVITDLAQSPEIEVVEDPGAEDPGAEAPAAERLPQLAGAAATVLQGSFVKSGERLRINFNLLDTASGRILLRDWVEDSPERLFAMVDEVSRTTRGGLGVPQHVELADSVEEVTTSSYEAWRSFSKGRELYRQSRWEEARPHLEAAIARDGEFALAFAELGNLHKNLGDDRLARLYTGRAVEHARRLPIQQRYFVEGEHYSATWSGYGRAIEAYRQGVELFPDDLGLRNNLAAHLAYLEHYEQASREYRASLDRGDVFGGTYHSAATVEGALGHFEAGKSIIAEYARRHADDWFAQLALGWYLTEWEQYAAASDSIGRADALRPDDLYVWQGWWRLQTLREDWQGAADSARRMSASTTSYGRWLGLVSDAWTDLYQGRSGPAAERLAESTRAYPEPEAYTALSHCWTARLALRTGRPEDALAAALRAQQQAPGDWPELEGMFLAALAEQALGRPAEADRIAANLRERAAKMPNPVQERQLHHLLGRLALARGDAGTAVRELRAAADLLPPRGFWFHWHVLPDHIPAWYDLAEAELAAGRPRQAAEWFLKVAASGAEHLEHPLLYVRSFYRLGKIYEALGDTQKAAEAFGRFHGYWRSGDLDRREVEEAAAKSDLEAQPESFSRGHEGGRVSSLLKALPWATVAARGRGAAGSRPSHRRAVPAPLPPSARRRRSPDPGDPGIAGAVPRRAPSGRRGVRGR